MRRMKKLTALMLAVLLMMQLLPVSAAAENPEEVISDVYTAPVYHTVSFTAEGEEIASLFVNDGAAINRLPDAPEVEGKTFTGWFVGETPVTAETAVTEDLTVTAVYTETEAPAPENGALAEGKDYYLTGKLPDGIVEVVPVTVEIAGAEVLAACDVRVTAARKLLAKGEAEQAENGAMQLHFYQEAFASEIVDIYRMADAESPAEYITTVKAENGWVTFDADASAIYAVVRTKLTKTVTTSDGATYEIEVTYKNTSGIPMDGTDLLVSEIREGDAGYDAYISASADKLGINPESIEISRAFDISIVDEADHNIVYEPSGEVDVSITLAGSALYEYAAVDVVHLVGDENTKGLTAYDMNSTVTGETVRFTTDSFSVYVVVGEVYLRTYRFYTLNEYGDYTEYVFENDTGAVTFTQSIKNGETPVVPGSPANPQDPTAVFAGWYQGDGSMEPVFDDNASPYDFDNIPEITGNEVVYLYARFLSYAYVIFHDQFDAETGTYPVAYTERAELINGSASVSISGKHVVYSNGKDMVFSGWADEDGEPVQTEEGKIKVTGTTHLYPLFSPVFWLSFDSGPTGSGATYYPDTYYLNGEGPSTLADHIPTRDGNYTFDGWFTGADGTGAKIAKADGSLNDGASADGISVSDGKIKLTADVKLYAKWTVRTTADYTIVIQKLKALEGNTTDYEFAESFSRSGTIGDTISVDNPYKELNDYTVYNALHPDAGVTEDTNPYKGYAFNETKSDTSVEIKADSSSVLNIYYDWSEMPDMTGRTYTLTFADSVETAGMSSPDLPVVYNQAEGDHAKVAYNAVLEGYEPDAAPASGRADYTFTGWFADKACTIRVFFTQETYNAFTGNKVLFETMPGRDLTVYAGWEKLWFVVTIDPNYGAMYAYNSQGILEGTGSTWFWSAYGDKIQEYTTVTRNFVESDSGTYYYVNHAGDGTGSSVWPDRYTYYTTNPSEATGFATFSYEPGIYRYDGWYEVKEDGSEEPYDFSKIVDHNITLKLHWTKVGAFYLQYVAGEGTLNGEEELEPLYVELDGGSYADNAEVVITRSATAPDGYVFVGWTIRGDVSGTVYRPGQTFTLLTSYAATVQGKETVFLEAVYTKVPTASIIYHANGGIIDESSLDYGSLPNPSDPSNPTPLSGDYNSTEGTLTVTGLTNNSQVYLSDGDAWLSMTDAEFAGWCSNRVYDADDESAPLFVPNTLYGIDVEGENDLYAIWQVSVNYHLNNEDPDADFGGDWGTDYSRSGDTYVCNGFLGSTVKYPPYDPSCTGQEFLYWATRTGDNEPYTYTEYDFSQPVTGGLDLYALWGKTGKVPVHAAVISGEGFVEEAWVTQNPVSVGASGITMNSTSAADYVNPTEGAYEFAYAVVSDGLPSGQEEHVQKLYYKDGEIYITYADDSPERKLASSEELWFVFNSASESSIEVHVALVDVSGSIINQDSEWRSQSPEVYSFNLAPDGKEDFASVISDAILVPSTHEDYAFGAIFYGTEDNGTVTPAGEMNVVSVAYEPVKEGSNVYAIYLKDGNGKRLTELDNYNVYYLYYPKLTVYYLKESDSGELSVIQGSTDSQAVTDTITYGGEALTMNGAPVAQNQKVKVPSDGLTISQSVGSGNFNIPPLLDEGSNLYNLVYYKLGALAQESADTVISNISALNGFVKEDLNLYIKIVDNKLQWSFDETEWEEITNWPVVYAIYRERGYDLTITKTVPIDTGYEEPFTVTVSSTAITRSTYAVEGTGSNKIDAVPASGSEPGKIEFPVTDGSSVKIIGLGAGSYTITETDNENYILTAKIEKEDEDEDPTVEDDAVTLTLSEGTKLDLTNTPQYICQVGYRKFYTITSAVEWIEENSADFSGTIEMLVDNYLMPSSDAPVIPDYLNITLTSAEGTKTITRKDSFTSNAMFTNSGVFTLQNITLDGNSVSASGAMIDNEGTLTIGSGATLTNAVNTGNGGAVNSWSGSVSVVDGAAITGCTAESGSAIYASGGTVTVSGGTLSSNSAENGGAIYYAGSDSVTVSGGALEGNKAENGGAVYMSTGTLSVSGGSMTKNTAAENGGAVYTANATVKISGGTIGGENNGNSAANGGAVYAEAGSVTVSGGTVSYNTATANGGAISANTATVSVSGGSITSNTAAENGGAVYAKAGTVTVSKGTIDSNSAANGGGIYADSGAVTLSSDNGTTVLNGNTAVSGNGGAVYAASGAVSADKVKFTANHADSGNGGALWIGTGSATLSTCTMDTDNSAVNGAAVFTDSATVSFSAGSVTGNTASAGGAVGVGSGAARLYFSGNVQVINNTLGVGENAPASNVYLNQDSDAIINAGVGNNGLGSSASIGIYVAGELTGDLFINRGVPGAFFATYTKDSNVGRFSNDRLTGLSVQKDTTSKRLFWGKAFTVEVRYLESFSGCFPTVAAGTVKNIDNKTSITYYAPSSSNAASEIADDLRSAHTISNLSGTAVFGAAFVGTDRTFANYITNVNWDSVNNHWSFIKRDGTEIPGDKLVVYFTEPSYISIENNTQYPLNVSALTVLGQNAINSASDTGYGYVFAVNGVIKNNLQPITAADLMLQPGKNIKLLFPGGKNAAWNLRGGFDGASTDIPCKLNGTDGTITAAEVGNFQLNGTTLNTNGGTYEIIFGSSKAICKIVTKEISSVQNNEIAGKTEADGDEKVEYTFSTLNQAVNFIKNHSLKTATIEMLVDYLIPGSDVVSLPAGYDITFTTATSGQYKYSDDANARAVISRDQGNNASFISVLDGNRNTTLTVKNLIFDGKNFGGDSISGGVIRTKAADVVIDNVVFQNCVAKFGGGIYIESVNKNSANKTPYGSLTVTNSSFIGCSSTHSEDKYGGGAIWTSMQSLTVTNCSFTSCHANRQAGAVFHYVGGNYDTWTNITGSTFAGCDAQAAGSLESGAKYVTITDCSFQNSTATQRNGGAVNVWALDQEKPTADCYVTLDQCTFENCYALVGTGNNGNGGAMRSTATHNTIINCTFINTVGNDGGAINIFNGNAVDTTISGCTFSSSAARNRGGAIYCMSKELIVDSTSSIQNCTATNAGGGIYHGRSVNGSSLAVSSAAISNCYSQNAAGGGIYSSAQMVSLSGVTVENCSSPKQGGGIYHVPGNDSASSCSITDSLITGNSATEDGGGLYYNNNNDKGTLILTFSGSTVSGNTSGGMGGGIYTDAQTTTLSGSTVKDNTAAGNGGGICHNSNSNTSSLTLQEGCAVTGNSSGGMGGGVYTLANLALQGTSVTGNSLSHNTADSAAGIYMPDGRTLTVGKTDPDTGYDIITVTGNKTEAGALSDLRLPMNGNVNSNSVNVLCDLLENGDSKSEIRVVNALVKGTQFGHTDIPYVGGFNDLNHVFIADDDSLYGIIDRGDSTHKKIIWGMEPICKITDDRGRLLYLKEGEKLSPAVFDYLDINNGSGTNEVSAFGILRGHSTSAPKLYNADGSAYTGTTYQVKMLVENYTADSAITTPSGSDKTVILTTAGSGDSLYPYRGRSGTRSTILRGSHENAMVAVKSNLTLQNIVLDSGSEAGAPYGANSRILLAETAGTTIRLGKNAALQNAKVSGGAYGAGLRLNNTTASMIIEGGSIRNCSTEQSGGGIQVKNGNLTIAGGSITRCTAADRGGGVYFENGTFTMTGGSITRCSASNGAGVYLANGQTINMSGGSISGNTASSSGGGIAVGGKNARLVFSGAPYVYGNTLNGEACNVQMDQHFEYGSLDEAHAYNTTVIVSEGLVRGATIGVYVPDGADLYDKHGNIEMPFGTYKPGSNTETLNYFINDRNALKGGLYETQAADNYMIYWVKIYSLKVSKLVISDDPRDAIKEFSFTVVLSGEASNIPAQAFNGTYGDMTFVGGVANFKLKSGESITAEKMPLGYGYTVTENLSEEEKLYYKTSPGLVQSGKMDVETRYLYEVDFNNIHAICKITDANEGLLYYEKDGQLRPAVYSELQNAFNALSVREFYNSNGDPVAVNTPGTNVEMLVDYTLEGGTTFGNGIKAILTTADKNAEDGFPYVGEGDVATITRGYNGTSMITVNGDLTIGDIVLDGNSTNKTANANGGLLNVPSGGKLTVGSGSVMQNSTTSGNGAGVYLAAGALMNISGAPVFSNNFATNVTLGTDPKNGGDNTVYPNATTAPQDIYIANYSSSDAPSLVVTGNISPMQDFIWVWADAQRHYEQSKQFAVMSGGTYTGLDVFRNARPDTETKNPLKGSPLYLYGISRGDGNVYWSGSMDLSVSKTVTGDFGDQTKEFVFTVTGLDSGVQYDYIHYASIDGTTGVAGKLTAEDRKISFILKHREKIVISIPGGTEVTVSEENGVYTASYSVDDGTSVSGSSATITLDTDKTVAFTNNLKAVSPTSYHTNILPYALMLATGLLLGAGMLLLPRRRRRGGG